MKKGDAAAHAEHFMQHTRWVPAWLQGPQSDAVKETASVDTETDADNTILAA